MFVFVPTETMIHIMTSAYPRVERVGRFSPSTEGFGDQTQLSSLCNKCILTAELPCQPHFMFWDRFLIEPTFSSSLWLVWLAIALQGFAFLSPQPLEITKYQARIFMWHERYYLSYLSSYMAGNLPTESSP